MHRFGNCLHVFSRGFGKRCGAVVVKRRWTGVPHVLREVGLSGAAEIKMLLLGDCYKATVMRVPVNTRWFNYDRD